MRRREFEVTDQKEIIRILDESKVLHLGMSDEGWPYVLPMNYGYTLEGGELILYLHGGMSGYKFEVIQKNPRVSFAMECDVEPFAGKVACQYGMTYFSLLGKGTAEIVEDVEEKKRGLSVLMRTQTGKEFAFDDKLASIVKVIKVTVSEYWAKNRPLPPAMR